MKVSIFKFTTFGLILLSTIACKTLNIEKPKESYLPSKIEPVTSELPLKIELDVKKLEASVNKKLTGVLFEGSNLSNKDLTVRVSKAQNFSFTVNNNIIEYRVPLKVWSRFAWKVEKFGISVGDFYEANGSIALVYKTAINFDKNWQLVAKTSSSGFEWIEVPRISVVGVSVPVTPIANLALQKCDKLITDQIDKTLSEMVDAKKYISLAWSELQKPRQLNAENNIWLRISPKDIYILPFNSLGNKLNMGMSLSAQIESFMGAKPAQNPLVNLPAFKMQSRPSQQFNLNIGVDVTFDKISEMAKKELLGKTFTEGNKSITISNLSIFGSEGKAIFMADVVGSLKGRIYFTGNMIYNPTKMAIEITEPAFDVKTSNALVKSAGWLLHGMILKKITPYLTYPIKADLDNLKMKSNEMLRNYSIMDGINLQGSISTLGVEKLDLIPGAVRIQTNIKGNVGIKIDDLKL